MGVFIFPGPIEIIKELELIPAGTPLAIFHVNMETSRILKKRSRNEQWSIPAGTPYFFFHVNMENRLTCDLLTCWQADKVITNKLKNIYRLTDKVASWHVTYWLVEKEYEIFSSEYPGKRNPGFLQKLTQAHFGGVFSEYRKGGTSAGI